MAKATGTDLKPKPATPQEKPGTPEQYANLTGEIAVAIAKAKPSFALMQKLLGRKKATRSAVAQVLAALEMKLQPDPRLLHSQKLWAKLGVAVEVEELEIPELPNGLTEVAIIPQHLSNEELFALGKKHYGDAWKYYGNLDDVKEEQARPKRTYVLGYRDGKEPDTAHLGKSYDVATKEGLIFMTLKEYQCVALLHFAATTGHLDEKGWTITSSVASDGYAWIAYWDPDYREFHVPGRDRSDSRPFGGPRQAVFA